MKTDNKKNIDTGKVVALYLAGWKEGSIADEIGVTVDVVKEILQFHEEKPVRECSKDKPSQPGKIVALTSEELHKIYERAAAIGAKEALKVFEQRQQKEYDGRADRRLRNTKLLLRNYHMLKEHAEKSVFGRTQMEESALDILESMMSMYDNEIIIESIKRSATRTAVIVSHIETMFDLYAVYCDKAVNKYIEKRRYEVLWDLYMAEDILSVKEVAKKQHVSKDTVYTDIKMAIEKLTALIFGVDGLNVR